MSGTGTEAAEVIEDVAKQVVPKVGQDLAGAYRGILHETADGLEGVGKRTLEQDLNITKDLKGIGRSGEQDAADAVEQDASRAAGSAVNSVGKDAGGASQAAAGDAGRLAAESEQEAAFTGREHGSGGSTDDPIDLVTGEMFLPQRDLALDGTLPLVLERRHGSSYRHGRLFGTTWSSTLDQRIEVDEDGIHFAAADGRVLHYPVPTVHGQRVLPSHGPRWPLTWDRTEDAVRIEQGDLGCWLHFPRGPVPDRFRPLAAVTDRAGNRITVVCDTEAVPTDVYHSGGYHLRLTSQGTRGGVRIAAVSLADPGGGRDVRIREFRYDTAGRLVETREGGCDAPLVFEYDETDRIVRWVDRGGHDYRYHYREEDGRVSHAEGAGGYLDVRLDYDLDARTTTLTDATGAVSVHHWNELLQVVKVVDVFGGQTLTERDRFGGLLAATDQLGHTTQFERDANGDTVRVLRPDGSATEIVYDEHRLAVSATEPDGSARRYGYDDRGALTSVTDQAGAVTRYTRDERGALTSITDPLGHTTAVVCDRAGLPVELTDASGRVRGLRRDLLGRVIELVEADGTPTRLEWDTEGRLTARRNADGSSETWEYDGDGNLVTHTSPAGGVTAYEYGPFDTLVSRTDADGVRYQFTYDAQLRLLEVRAPGERSWRYTYDAAGRLVAETDFNGARRSYGLDAAGRVATMQGAAGQQVSIARDPMGRVTERTAGQDAYRYTYDPAGRLARAEGPETVVEFERDRLGRVLRESLNGRALINQFDPAGRRVSRTTPGGVVSRWTHGPAGDVLALDGTAGSLAFDYDAAGRESARTLGPAASLTMTYDELGRLSGQGVWAYDRAPADAVGHAASGWRQLQERTYTYRADGRPLEITDRLRGDRTYTLTGYGRVTAVTGRDWHESYAYDEIGNISAADFAELAAQAPSSAGSREISGTRTRRAGRTHYEYDGAGRLIRRMRRTLSGQQRTTAYTWDAENRLVSVTTPDDDVWWYKYDALGRRVAKSRLDSDGNTLETIWFTWDGAQVAEETRHRDGNLITLTWDYRPDGTAPSAQTRRSWAGGAPQTEIDTEFHAIVTDLVGTPQELVAPDGRITWHRRQTLWGVTSAQEGSAADCPLRQPGQYHDAETGLHYNFYRYYDPETATYLSPDPLGLAPAPNPQAYVDNPLHEIDPLGLAPCFAGMGRPDLDGKPIAAVGRLPDTSQKINEPGYDVLNDPAWTIAKNDEWVNGHIKAGNPVHFVSELKPENLWDAKAGRETVTAREIRMFQGAGYTWHIQGSDRFLLPPVP